MTGLAARSKCTLHPIAVAIKPSVPAAAPISRTRLPFAAPTPAGRPRAFWLRPEPTGVPGSLSTDEPAPVAVQNVAHSALPVPMA